MNQPPPRKKTQAPPDQHTTTVAHISNLNVFHGNTPILDSVSFTIAAGECFAIVGESGAGKSVLAKTLLGLTHSEPGWNVHATHFQLAGQEMLTATRKTWRSLLGSTLSLITQDPMQALDPLRTIEAEVGETLAIQGIRKATRQKAVLTALTTAGLPTPGHHTRKRPGQLSGGMRQRALIASAIIGSPQLVIADEPTTALDPFATEHILTFFEHLTAQHTALLLISHDLNSVARIAHRVAVMDHGRIVETGPTNKILKSPRHNTTRLLINSIPSGPKTTPTPPPGQPLITLTGVSRHFKSSTTAHTGVGSTHSGINLSVYAGETLGVVGHSGAGKTTLARILVGAEPVDNGQIWQQAGCRIRLIPQDPLATFDPRWRVDRILRTAAGHRSITPTSLLHEVGLDIALLARTPATLSGGQRQRVAIARALAAEPDILVCDEAVSALDVSAQASILTLLRHLQNERSLTTVFISHDLATVRTLCDRVIVMHEGLIINEGSCEQLLNPSSLSHT